MEYLLPKYKHQKQYEKCDICNSNDIKIKSMDVTYQDGICQGNIYLMCTNNHCFFIENADAKILTQIPPCNRMMSSIDTLYNGVRISFFIEETIRKKKC